jgi:hypothetical protein
MAKVGEYIVYCTDLGDIAPFMKSWNDGWPRWTNSFDEAQGFILKDEAQTICGSWKPGRFVPALLNPLNPITTIVFNK